MAPQVRLAGTVSVRVTVPLKTPTAVTVIVEVAEVPACTAAGEVAAIVKSLLLNVNVAVVEWDSVPLVPVMVTVNVPAVVELQESVDVPDPAMLPGLIAPHVRPAGTVSVSVTVPVKPLTAVTVIVEVPDEPTIAVGDVAAMVKSCTVNVAVVEWDSVPLVPVIVSV